MKTIRTLNDLRFVMGTPQDSTVYEVEARQGDRVTVERFDEYEKADERAVALWLDGWEVVLQGVKRWTVYTLKERES